MYMSENICIPKSYFLIITSILIVFTYFYGMKMKDSPIQQPSKIIIFKDKKEFKKNEQVKTESPIENPESEFIRKIKLLRQRDRVSLYNDFKPPERRLSRQSYPNTSLKQIINIPTRGYPDDYHNVGMLVRKNDEKMLKLFGRQKHPGSNQWEYFVIGNDSNNLNTKMPLKVQNQRELSNNDTIMVPWLDQSKGKFEVKIFDYNAPRYNPFVF